MSTSWSNYFFGGYRQKREDHSDVVDLLESVSQRDWSAADVDRKEVDDIVKRLRYRHPRTPPRQSRLSRHQDVVGQDEALQLNVLDSMNNMLPRASSNIKIDSSSMPNQGGELLRDFGGSVVSSKSDSSDGRSQGTDGSADDSFGTSSS
ncbi:unnamed protein product [Cylindrotheca closterium]|uniref:Uncharacterized protein n=1 Tax=Cylindrotheca closterium TaxID=2856 RepID=A0AAD2CYG3_9STRA|nr:unnamed protein product [Cylindrotheca closterium]